MDLSKIPHIEFTTEKKLNKTVNNLAKAKACLVADIIGLYGLDVLGDVDKEVVKETGKTIKKAETIDRNQPANKMFKFLKMENKEIEKKKVPVDFDKKDIVVYDNYAIQGLYPGMATHFDLDTTIALLYGTGNIWIRSVLEMSMWYMTNVHTYQGNADGHADNSRADYECDLFDDNTIVQDDCTAFITACLVLLAYKKDQTLFNKYKNIRLGSDGFGEDGPASEFLKDLGFEYKAVNPNNMFNGEYEDEEVNKGDILCVFTDDFGSHEHHGEIYWGQPESIERGGVKHYSWGNAFHQSNMAVMSWGNIHDNLGNHWGMPSPVVRKHYSHCWQYVG